MHVPEKTRLHVKKNIEFSKLITYFNIVELNLGAYFFKFN